MPRRKGSLLQALQEQTVPKWEFEIINLKNTKKFQWQKPPKPKSPKPAKNQKLCNEEGQPTSPSGFFCLVLSLRSLLELASFSQASLAWNQKV